MHPFMVEAIVHQYQAERRRLAEQHRLGLTEHVITGANRTADWHPRRMRRTAIRG